MNININSKTVKRLIVPALILILIIICVEIKENSMEDKFAVTISSMNEEKQNLNEKINSLEEELKKAREENGHMSNQLRNAKENMADSGRLVKDNDDRLIIEAYDLYLEGKVKEAQKKVEVLDTTYLTELQLHIYKQIMIDK
ncbi:MAG: hypothetical protein E7396_00105 [Ruminococcaceae bacterium]|nr:hypothetical protein [Oscillospiraceae bacterium]